MTFKDKALRALERVRPFQQACDRERFSPRPITHRDETIDSFVSTESDIQRTFYPRQMLSLWAERDREINESYRTGGRSRAA